MVGCFYKNAVARGNCSPLTAERRDKIAQQQILLKFSPLCHKAADREENNVFQMPEAEPIYARRDIYEDKFANNELFIVGVHRRDTDI
jgi:hypothetical protein